MVSDNTQTSVTLLDSIRMRNDQTAWNLFYSTYSTRINAWCSRWGTAPDEIEDVIQETMLSVLKKIDLFNYDPQRSFRAWLKTVAWRTWKKFENKTTTARLSGHLKFARNELLLNAQSDFMKQFELMADYEIMSIACHRVRLRIESKTWDIFVMTDCNNMAGTVVADQMGLSIGAVHTASCRVRKMIRDEVAILNS